MFSRGQKTDSVTAFIFIIISIITEVLAWGHPSWSDHGIIDLPLAAQQVTANFPHLPDPTLLRAISSNYSSLIVELHFQRREWSGPKTAHKPQIMCGPDDPWSCVCRGCSRWERYAVASLSRHCPRLGQGTRSLSSHSLSIYLAHVLHYDELIVVRPSMLLVLSVKHGWSLPLRTVALFGSFQGLDHWFPALAAHQNHRSRFEKILILGPHSLRFDSLVWGVA